MNLGPSADSIQHVAAIIHAVELGILKVPANDADWARRLLALPRGYTGLLDVRSLSSEDLSKAKSFALTLKGMNRDQLEAELAERLETQDAQCELFRLFEKLFIGLTGVSSMVISSQDEIRQRMIDRIGRGNRAKIWADYYEASDELKEFYKTNGTSTFRIGKEIGGVKVILGGQRAFGPSALNATRVAGLYCDTQLIPDPVYPFFSSNLYLNAQALQLALALFYILPLRPLVDARLPEPPILIFPSFEQVLERNDPVTQAGIASLAVRVIGPVCDGNLQSIEEIAEYAKTKERSFVDAVMRERLFVPPGADPQITMTAEDAAAAYLREVKGVRSSAMVALMERQPLGALLLNGIVERLTPQYHLLENADELAAQPMLSQLSHWHYFERCASASARELVNNRIISRESWGALRSLQDNSLKWLANIPIEGLVELRRNLEHAEFRGQLQKYTSQLTAAGPADLESITREVRHGLEAMIQQQQKAIAEIEAKYSASKWKVTAGGGLGVAGAATMYFLPALEAITGQTAPVATAMGAIGLGVAGYTKELVGEFFEKRNARKSMLGLLAIARSK